MSGFIYGRNPNADTLNGLDSTAFAILAGQAGGQTLQGGTAANDDLTLEGTSHATKATSYVVLQPNGGRAKVGGDTAATMVPLEFPSTITNAPWAIRPILGSFLSVDDPTLEIGYNNAGGGTRQNTAESAIWIGMESDYANNVLQAGGETKHYQEIYFSSVSTAGLARRFLAFTIDRDAPDDYMTSDLMVSPAGRFGILRSTDGASLFNFGGGGILTISAGINFGGSSGYIQNSGTGQLSLLNTGANAYTNVTAVSHAVLSIVSDTNNDETAMTEHLRFYTNGAPGTGVQTAHITRDEATATLSLGYGTSDAITITSVGDVGLVGAMQFAEMTAPGAGAANTARIYAKDNGSGKTQLMVQFASGGEIQLAIEA